VRAFRKPFRWCLEGWRAQTENLSGGRPGRSTRGGEASTVKKVGKIGKEKRLSWGDLTVKKGGVKRDKFNQPFLVGEELPYKTLFEGGWFH